MGDDGFGPAVVRAFQGEYVVGPDVETVDLGTPGLDLMPWLADVERIVIVDTVRADRAPGTLKVYDKADILRHPPSDRVGPHDPGLKEALLTLEFAGRAPREVTLVGIVPARVALSLELTAVVQRMVPVAVEMIAATLHRAGATVLSRKDPQPPPSTAAELTE